MAKKLSFNDLPSAVEKILEILSSEESGHTALPELVQRVTVMEKRLDKIEQILSPDRPTMDKNTVMRVLKIRPRMLSELENSGVLLSHSEGRRKFYYEDDVVRCFMNQFSWKNILEEATKPVPAESAAPEKGEQADPATNETVTADGERLVDIYGASNILGRTPGAVRQQLSGLPHRKMGNKLYFSTGELEEWGKTHPSRKRKSKSDETQ